MDPAVRDFYRGWSDINTRNFWHAEWSEAYKMWFPFYEFTESYPGVLGFHLAMHNFVWQLADTGTFNKNIVILRVPFFSDTGNLEPPRDIVGNRSWGDPIVTIPTYAWNYPREKYRTRKSYWTGAPRRRRNL